MSYDEAREWFWVRTTVWFLVALTISSLAYYFYSDGIVAPVGRRILLSVICASGATLLAILAAWLSIETPWMQLGRWQAWLFNGIICAGIATIGGALVSAAILCFMRDNIHNYPSEELLSACHEMMLFGICLAAFWGLIFGSWFALRRDKYFVESF